MNGRPFHSASRHGEPEALARGLLDHDVGQRLERVDLDRADVVEVVEDVDVRVAVGVRERRVVEVPALGVVGGHRADERELDVRPLGLDVRYASITPSGSFHGSKRETWQIIGPVDVDPELLADEDESSSDSAMFFGVSGSIAGGTMFTPPSIPAGT